MCRTALVIQPGIRSAFLSVRYTNNSILQVKFTLELAMKALRGGVEVWLYSFFNLGAGWGWVVNATPRPLYPLE
jgi:hypothetical protein